MILNEKCTPERRKMNRLKRSILYIVIDLMTELRSIAAEESLSEAMQFAVFLIRSSENVHYFYVFHFAHNFSLNTNMLRLTSVE